MLKQFVLRFGLLAAVAAGLALGSARLSSSLAGDAPLTGAVADFNRIDPPLPAPGDPFRDSAGKELHLSDFRGKLVLLNIWATWCGPCVQEIPSLQKLHQLYGDKGLKLVAVSIDDYVSEDSIAKFAKNLGVTFQVLHDSTRKIENAYQVTGYPETFIIGPEGTIRRKWIGPDDWTSQGNRALIAQLLGLETPRPVADSADMRQPANLRGAR